MCLPPKQHVVRVQVVPVPPRMDDRLVVHPRSSSTTPAAVPGEHGHAGCHQPHRCRAACSRCPPPLVLRTALTTALAFRFNHAPMFKTNGLAAGMVSLSRARLLLPAQLVTMFLFSRKFVTASCRPLQLGSSKRHIEGRLNYDGARALPSVLDIIESADSNRQCTYQG